ncbi:MAG: polyprenol monophosphomannose synthase [Flavobacteriaceae bacterium]
MDKSLVIIPTYNEADNIALMLKALMDLAHPFSVLVVDDASPDGTAAIVADMMKKYPQQIFLENRAEKKGLGPAFVHGFRWAMAHDYAYIFEMDADFSHAPKDLERLFKVLAAGQAEVVIGSRYVKGIQVVNWPLGRILLSYGASLYVRLITSLPIKDTTAGFVGYKSDVLKSIDLNQVRFSGYAFQIEMKFKAWKKGFRLKEIPIVFTDRIRGVSKMNRSIISEAIFGIILMKIKSWYAN